MSWAYLEEFREMEDIREVLPIDFVMERLFDKIPNRGRKVRCVNPEHEDPNPSLSLWSPKNTSILTHFRCYGCNIRGDVMDLIEMRYNSNGETLAIAEGLLQEYNTGEHVTLAPRIRNADSQVELEFTWEEFKREEQSDAMIHAFLIRKQLMGKLPMEYCRDEWKWQGSSFNQGCVAMPHFSTSEELTGVKLRSTLNLHDKYGFDWSHYPELYGAWRDQGRQQVILTEGETDAVYAAYQHRDLDFDVLGIPTGISQNPTDKMKAQLQGRRVFMPWDAEQVSRDARDRWRDQLTRVVWEIRYVDLPGEGLDICKYAGSLPDLIQAQHQTGG